MLPELKFNEKMFKLLVEKKKSATRRKDPKDICGGLYVAGVCPGHESRVMMKCIDKYPQKISEMSEEDAVKEGFTNLEEFKQEIASIYGQGYLDSDPTMWAYEFQIVSVYVPEKGLEDIGF